MVGRGTAGGKGRANDVFSHTISLMSQMTETNRLDLEFRDLELGRDQLADGAKAASKRGIGGVWVFPSQVLKVAQALSTRGTSVVAAVSFPLGMSKSTIKAIEATSCIKDGATRVELWLNAGQVLRVDCNAIRSELLEITRAARAANPRVELFAAVEYKYPDAFSRLFGAVREGAFDGVSIQNFDGADAVAQMKNDAQGLKLKLQAKGSHSKVSELLAAGADIVGVEQF
jgi:hypothetical protein